MEKTKQKNLKHKINQLVKKDNFKSAVDFIETKKGEEKKFCENYLSRLYYYQANEFFDLKNYEKALQYYKESIKLEPNYASVYNGMGIVYNILQKYEKALKNFDKAIKLKENYIESYYNRANTYNNLENYEKAMKDLNKSIDLEPDYEEAYYVRGKIYELLGEYSHAIKDFKKTIQLDNHSIKAYKSRGFLYFHLKKYEDSLQDFNKIIKLNPKDKEAYYNRGKIHYYLKQYEEAILDFEQVIKIDENDVKAYSYRGNSYYNLKQYEEALKNFKQINKIDKSNSLAYYNRGITNINLKNFERSIKNYNKAIKLNENYIEAYYGKGLAYSHMQNYVDKSKKHYRKSIKLLYELSKENYKNQTNKIFYKFLPINKFTLDSLEKGYIYFNKIEQLNDSFNFLNWNENKFFKNMYSNTRLLSLIKASETKDKNDISENIKNLLMFDQYAEGHKGICIEYKIKDEILDDDIFYTDVIYKNNTKLDNLFEIFALKKAKLNYEKEIRFLYIKENDKDDEFKGFFKLKGKIKIKKIIFGIKTPKENKDLIKKLLSEKKKIKFYQIQNKTRNNYLNLEIIEDK